MRQKKISPPSSTGMGKRFRSPKLTLISAVNRSRETSPFSACLAIISPISSGPPTESAETEPVAIFLSPVRVRAIISQDCVTPCLREAEKLSSSLRIVPRGCMPISQAISSSPKILVRGILLGSMVRSKKVLSRSTVKTIAFPLELLTISGTSFHASIALPSMAVMRSFSCNPARTAGESGSKAPTCGRRILTPLVRESRV